MSHDVNELNNYYDLICHLPGCDLVDWLFTHVDGFADRRDARKYACNLLKAGYIRHTVNKITFSEQCYYVFGDLYGSKYFDIVTLMYHIQYGFRDLSLFRDLLGHK